MDESEIKHAADRVAAAETSAEKAAAAVDVRKMLGRQADVATAELRRKTLDTVKQIAATTGQSELDVAVSTLTTIAQIIGVIMLLHPDSESTKIIRESIGDLTL